MTYKFGAFIMVMAFLFSCKSKEKSNFIILKIILSKTQAPTLLNKYVYLVDYYKNKVIDSALVKGDTITFHQQSTPEFVPYMVSVQRKDTFQGSSYLHPMGIQSPYNENFVYSSFYLDKGVTILKPHDRSNRAYAEFIGSKQNEPFLRPIVLHYTEEKIFDRDEIIQKNISKIKAHPYSIHLLEQLYNYKEKFLQEDLKKQLSFFDDDIKSMPLFKRFTQYFAISKTYDKAFPLIEFESQNGDYQIIDNDSTKYYLIIFWASWCGPCRKEIPDIKKLYVRFTNKGLTITSISIDGDKDDWQTALQQEQMPWQQLIAFDSTKAFIDMHYSIKAIPKAYLYNQKKELIKKFDDALEMTKSVEQLF